MKKKRILVTAATAILGLSLVGAANASTINTPMETKPMEPQNIIYMEQGERQSMNRLTLTDEISKDNEVTVEKTSASVEKESTFTMNSEKTRNSDNMGLEVKQMPQHEDNRVLMEVMEPINE